MTRRQGIVTIQTRGGPWRAAGTTDDRKEGRLAALIALLLTALVAVLNTSPAAASTITARTLLFKLAVNSESGGSSYFTHWIDTNGDCQNTRAEVLKPCPPT